MTQWLKHWTPNPGVSCTKALSGSKVCSVFHLTEVDTRVPEMSIRNFLKLSGKSKPPARSGSTNHKSMQTHP